MPRLPCLAPLLVVPLVLSLAGCEIGLLVAAVTDEPTPDYYDPNEYTYCNELNGLNGLSAPLRGVEARSNLMTLGSASVVSSAPMSRLAADEQIDFFVVADGLASGPESTVEVSGDAERLDQSSGMCVPSTGTGAASFVSLETRESGEISIEILDDGVAFDRFDFTISRVEGIALSVELGLVRATLFDADGNTVFAQSGVDWEFVPSNPSVGLGPLKGLSAPLFWDGVHSEMQVTVFFQDLETTTTVRYDPTTGFWGLAD
jgi:hypothetical protein